MTTDKFATTDKWFKYVGDSNLDKVLAMKPGEALHFQIPPTELEACKWQWYKTLRWLGKNSEYRQQIAFDLGIFSITKKHIPRGILSVTAGQAPTSIQPTPVIDITLTEAQANINRLTIEALSEMPTDGPQQEAIISCLQNPETPDFTKVAVRKYFAVPEDPSPTSTEEDESPDEDFIDSLGAEPTE